MNTIISFLVQILLTLILSSVIVSYIRPTLRKVLVDLCGTEERAQFWTAFSNVLLIGLPAVLALNYKPKAGNLEELFFEVASRLSGTLSCDEWGRNPTRARWRDSILLSCSPRLRGR